MKNTQEIIETFSLLESWEDRYRYIIELGSKLDVFPKENKKDIFKVFGCMSQVWITKKINNKYEKDPILTFKGDSDSYIVKGLIYISFTFYSNKKASEILKTHHNVVLQKLNLDKNLTLQRSNGLRAIIYHLQKEAKFFIKTD